MRPNQRGLLGWLTGISLQTGMTAGVFDYARAKGTDGKIGQLAPLQRYAVAEEVQNSISALRPK